MKKSVLAVLMAACIFAAPMSARGEVKGDTVPAAQSVAVGAKACIVMEAMTGRVLFAQNIDERLPMASTTKIMTALIALEQPGLDELFEVDKAAIMVEGSSMGLMPGDQATLRTLAKGMLLSSGNDAANAAAVQVAGSVSDFVALMNAKAAELGMANTSFETPSGLDGEHHYSTARDMAVLTQEALRNEQFAEICSQYKIRASYGNPPYDRWLTNHNRLLSYYEGTIGVKTGFTKKSGRCLVSAAQRDGVDLICVTLSCSDDWNVHKTLYERYFDRVHVEDLSEGLAGLRVPVTGGALLDVAIEPAHTAQIPVDEGDYKIEYDTQLPAFLYAPVEKGQLIGSARILLDGREVAVVEMIATHENRLLHPYEEKTTLWEKIKGIFS